jgi:hypothetical protein
VVPRRGFVLHAEHVQSVEWGRCVLGALTRPRRGEFAAASNGGTAAVSPCGPAADRS